MNDVIENFGHFYCSIPIINGTVNGMGNGMRIVKSTLVQI